MFTFPYVSVDQLTPRDRVIRCSRWGTKGVRSLCCVRQQLTKVSTAPTIALTAIHEPEIRQRGNPFRGKVLKRSQGNGFINFRYQTTVRKQQKRITKGDIVLIH